MEYYIIHIVSDEPLQCCGKRYCTWEKDVDFILSLYPYSRVEKYRTETTESPTLSELRDLFS